MQVEIKISGCPFEDSETLNCYMNAIENAGVLYDVKEMIYRRLKHGGNVSDSEEQFLRILLETLVEAGD